MPGGRVGKNERCQARCVLFSVAVITINASDVERVRFQNFTFRCNV